MRPVWARLLPYAWFLGALGVYLSGLAGSFLADDSPETISAMVSLEPQHPPGYPLLTLLGKLATLMPLGGPSFRICFLAAVAAALAAATAGVLARDVTRRLKMDESSSAAAGTLAAALLAFSWTFWTTGLSAKGAVYSVNVCLLGLALHKLIVPGDGESSWRGILGVALVFGAGLAHHWMSFAAAAPGMLVLLVPNLRRRGMGHAAAVAAFLLLAGASVYLFLPFRASTPLDLNWGRPDSLDRFLSVVTREQYRDVEFAPRGPGYWQSRITHLVSFSMREWSPWLVAAGIPGVIALAAGLRYVLAGLLLVAVFVWGGAFFFAHPLPDRIFITEPYLVPALMVWAVLGGAGLAWAGQRYGKLNRAQWISAAAAIIFFLFIRGHRSHDFSRYHLSYDYGVNLLSGVPSGSVVFCEGDYDLFSLLYLDQVSRQRPDVVPVAAIFLDYDWYRNTAHRILPDVIPLEHEQGQMVVRAVRPLVYTSQHGGGEGVLKPVGLTMRPPLWEGYGTADSLRTWRALRFRGIWKLFENPPGMERDLLDSYGLQMARLAGDVADGDPRTAMALYRKALLLPMQSETEASTRLALARILLAEGKAEEAERHAVRAVDLAPESLEALVVMADISRARGDRPRARHILFKALLLIPAQGMETQREDLGRMLRELE